MIDLWYEEAKKCNVFPLTDVSSMEIHQLEYHVATPKTGRYVYYPGTTAIPQASAARTLGASFKILAEVEFTGEAPGIIVSQWSRFGGMRCTSRVASSSGSTTSWVFRRSSG